MDNGAIGGLRQGTLGKVRCGGTGVWGPTVEQRSDAARTTLIALSLPYLCQVPRKLNEHMGTAPKGPKWAC
jgi:hypothetical protein